MRIQSLSVENFRALTSVRLDDLKQSVVIAGPNGCGKSCVFDAIRLLKSVYGGYQPNEWQNWFGEFQINIKKPGSWTGLFQNRSKHLNAEAAFCFSDEELRYFSENAKQLLSRHVWKDVAPERAGWDYLDTTPLASHLRVHEPEVEQRVNRALPEFLRELEKGTFLASIRVTPEGRASTEPSLTLEIAFSTYDPQYLGIIDYHGATRNYNREQLGGINLNVTSSEDRLKQHALYNYGVFRKSCGYFKG